jgi:hypothetical protein
MCERRPISRRNLVEAALALAASPLLRYVPAALADQADISEIAPGVFVHQGRYEIQSPENRGDMANYSFSCRRSAHMLVFGAPPRYQAS